MKSVTEKLRFFRKSSKGCREQVLMKIMLSLLFQIGCLLNAHAEEKEVYIPKETLAQDFENPESDWSKQRMRLTPNFTILWEKGFGDDPMNAPAFNGQSMSFDLDVLEEGLESIFPLYRNTLKFVEDNSKCDKYRMVVFVKYSDDRTARGGSRDHEIGIMWLTPLHIKKGKYNILAHELGHCFQHQIGCDRVPHWYYGSHGFQELCAQWMLWQYNEKWVTDELYHLNNYVNLTHKPFTHWVLRGEAPFVLQYWSEKHGQTFLGKLYREGYTEEDAISTYKRMLNLSQTTFCDELFDAFCHTVNLDFDRDWNGNRSNGLKFGVDCQQRSDGYLEVAREKCPESYGFNAVNLAVPMPGKTVTVQFEGLTPQSPYVANHTECAGWRYGFVIVDSDGYSHYGQRSSANIGKISFTAPRNYSINKLWLVVMGAPTEHWDFPNDKEDTSIDAQWPYKIRVDYNEEGPQDLIEITVSVPGGLKGLIEENAGIRTAKSLRINGKLNGTDILSLRRLAGRTYDGQSVESNLEYLDLTETHIVDGGERYSNDVELDDSGTKADVFPAHAFQNTKIRTCILPNSVTSIGRYAFGACNNIESVEYGPLITSIDFAAFTFSSLKEFTVRDEVVSLGNCVFYNMKNIESVHIGNGLTAIPWKTFYECTNLKCVDLGSNVGIIASEAFSGCSKLEQIDFPASLKNIETQAFAGADRLKVITCKNAKPESISLDAFSDDTYTNAILYVPMGSATLYKQSLGWSRFANIVEQENMGIIRPTVPVDNFYVSKSYDLHGRKLPNGYQMSGISIANGKKHAKRR